MISLVIWSYCCCCSVAQLYPTMQLHGLQHARPPYLSQPPRACSNSCPLSWWCHPTISSSVICFSSCPQSFSTSGSFQMSQLFASAGQSIRVSASTSDLPMNTQGWFSLGWTGWISWQSKGLSRVFSTPQFTSINSLVLSFLYTPTLTSIHDHWKNHNLNYYPKPSENMLLWIALNMLEEWSTKVVNNIKKWNEGLMENSAKLGIWSKK